MPLPPDPSRRAPLTRADLPADLTAETLRHLDLQTLRRLSRPGNGVLDPAEQKQFNAALAEVRRSTTSLVEQSLERARAVEPRNLDPAMRRSYARTQRRLAEQARRAGRSFPLSLDPAPVETDESPQHRDTPHEDHETEPVPSTPDADTAPKTDAPTDDASTDDVSPAALAHDVEQTSDTLDMLERIASLQQEQVEHQHNQLLTETRGIFFAFLVSVAVIVAGVAPLVEAEPHTRLLIIVWTVAITAVAGLVYALVRGAQAKK